MLRVERTFWIERRWVLLAAFALLLVVPLVALVLAKPEQVSDTLLRAGGRIVLRITNRPGWAALVAVSSLLLVWVSIGLRCLVECARDPHASSADIPQIPPTSGRSSS